MKYRVKIRFGEEPDTMPEGWKFGRVSCVATDSDHNVYVFQRGPKADPIIVFNDQGIYQRSWGAGVFARPHGLRVDRQNFLWTVDDRGHRVQKWPLDGKLLMSIGFFLEDDDKTGTANFLTEDGLKLLDAAILFALEES